MSKPVTTKQNFLLPLDIQFFAEGGEVENNGGGSEDGKGIGQATEKVEATNEQKKNDIHNGSATEEMIKKIVQSETDKIRTEYSKKLKEKDIELENFKKSKMSEDEIKEFEAKQRQEELASKEKEIAEALTQIQQTKMELLTVDLLKEHELPIEAKGFLVNLDADKTKENVVAFKTMFDEAVQKGVNAAISGTSKEFKKGDTAKPAYTMDQLKNLSTEEARQLIKSSDWKDIASAMVQSK
ncbi:capsid assembly scaffolding protein Gp46 family protein [Bacillus badius]|uniref:capsid assembly scaffolding protein Gp46 family protein n=1 Tax=Bacillus badius TaxID=1455 RepID=UPI0005ADA636|nr:DUF4355 domain-containing protein [Bacillus badius]KIL74360.1 hypothetical protein SD78_1429 [Bacillus badius]